jgi:hypothetical protein
MSTSTVEQSFLQLKDAVKRPKFDPKKIDRADKQFTRLVDDYIRWCKTAGSYDESLPREDYENEIIFAIEESVYEPDGYQLTKKMEEKFYFEADANLVSILDGISHTTYTLRENLYKNWVKENFLVIPESVLHKKVKFPRYSGLPDSLIEGNITSIRPETYDVTIREGSDHSFQPGGFIIHFENVKIIE